MSLQVGTPHTLRLDTENDLAGGTGVEIHYRKPDGSTGEWSGSDGVTTSGNIILYQFGASDIDQAGTWAFQGQIQLPGTSDPYKTAVVEKFFNQPLKTT